jgi:hypothetical protein
MTCLCAVLDKLSEHTQLLMDDPLGLALLNGTSLDDGMFADMLEVMSWAIQVLHRKLQPLPSSLALHDWVRAW